MSMQRRYVYKLALKNIFAHKLRSFLTTAGIAIGVGFIIFLVSLGYGLQQVSTKEIADIEALRNIEVAPGKSKIIEITDETIAKFKKVSNVEEAHPQLNVVANISSGTSIVEGVVYGKDKEVVAIENMDFALGEKYDSNVGREALINLSALKQLGLNTPQAAMGKKIGLKMIIPKEALGRDEGLVKEDEFTIVGVLKNESSPYVYVPLESFKSYGVKKYTSAKVRVSDKKYTDIAKKELENMGYKTVTLKETVDQINQFFVIFQLILLSFGSIAIIIAAIGMFNTLTISLLEKTREISFMKVMGTTSRDIWSLFLGEAVLIGTFGSSLGIIGGLAAGEGLNRYFLRLAEQTGNRPVEIFYTPVIFIVITFFLALLVSILTGIYPSFRASRIDPLEAMRYE